MDEQTRERIIRMMGQKALYLHDPKMQEKVRRAYRPAWPIRLWHLLKRRPNKIPRD